VIPVLIGKATMPAQEQLPTELKMLCRRNAAEVKSGRDFHNHVDRLIQGIEFLLQTRQKADEQKAHPPQPERKPEEIITNSLGMRFSWIPPGTFMMGSPQHEEGREPYQGADETQHKVTLTKGFYMGIHPITRGQFATFVEETG
jgi:formylglycine-generating enzyme required for sulfatase activity